MFYLGINLNLANYELVWKTKVDLEQDLKLIVNKKCE
tara:strand:- start:255 stop:365 length:111 start_codon:yes stop_codon:yes gene_type:complete